MRRWRRQYLFDLFVAWLFVLYADGVLFAGDSLIAHPGIQQMHAEAIRVREAAGITTHYVLDEDLCRLCQRWAQHMAATESMYHGGGENIIAMGYATIPDAIRAWRNSGGHWAHMGGRDKRAGWGYAISRSGRYYWAGAMR
jgi:hypothetical protein